MAARFVLYYWPIPFRAQAARFILAHAGVAWEEPGVEAVDALRQQAAVDQPTPFMGPPVLHDRVRDVWLAQSTAICGYLGETLGLMPGEPAADALTRKVLADCVDVLQEMTRDCGAQMWTDGEWAEFAEARLPRWLGIFEETGRRHGLRPEGGTLLGTAEPGVADLACAALWATMADCLPDIRDTLAECAPCVFALSERIAATPALAALRADQRARWDDVWCEGLIEESLRAVLANWRQSVASAP